MKRVSIDCHKAHPINAKLSPAAFNIGGGQPDQFCQVRAHQNVTLQVANGAALQILLGQVA